MKLLKTLFLLLLLALLGAGLFIYSGRYNIAADQPHWTITESVMESFRDRAIGHHAADIEVPKLDDESLIRSGAGNYDAMCVSCHLKPGSGASELSLGLYPTPPDWSKLAWTDPRAAFWVIKHGVKMSGMPAWGKSMDDRYIWGMVAFLRTMQDMTAEQYAAAVAASGGHDHGGGETGVTDGHDGHALAPGGAGYPATPAAPRSSFEPVDDPMSAPADEETPQEPETADESDTDPAAKAEADSHDH